MPEVMIRPRFSVKKTTKLTNRGNQVTLQYGNYTTQQIEREGGRVGKPLRCGVYCTLALYAVT